MVLAAVVAATVGAASCSDSSKAPPAPTTTAAPATVAERPTTTVAPSPRTVVTISSELGPGEARVGGTVTGPEGPVPGATVKVERLVDDVAAAETTVESGPDGRWGVESVNGGRYRLRAWRAPDLAQVTAAVVFVTVGESPPVDLPVQRFASDAQPAVAVAPDPPAVGQPAIVVVTVASGGVDNEGVVHSQPRQGVPVAFAVSPNVGITTPTLVATDASGNAAFQIVCREPGPIGAMATVASFQTQVPLSPCVAG